MSTHRVVWKDGLFVQPQHFQQAERNFLDLIQQNFYAYIPYFYGFLSYAIATETFHNGIFSLTNAWGILPDGTPFHLPENDDIPAARSFEERFDHQKSSLDVFLALPIIQDGKPSYVDESSTYERRYRRVVELVRDEVFGQTQEEIEVGKCNFVIRFEDENCDGLSMMQIARLTRNTEGEVILDNSYVPPLLRINAAEKYLKLIKSIVTGLQVKGTNLLQGRKQMNDNFAEFTSDDLTSYALLNTISTYTPRLDHLLQDASKVHPYELHTTLTLLSGSLGTFKPGEKLIRLPNYDHQNLYSVLTNFQQIINSIIGVDYSPRCVTLPVDRTSDTTYLCTINDKTLLTNANFYLGLSADINDEELGQLAKQIMKICAKEMLPRLTISAIPGLTIAPVINPPIELAAKPGFIYLMLHKEGQYWEGIIDSATIAIYFPNSFTDLKLELLALKSR